MLPYGHRFLEALDMEAPSSTHTAVPSFAELGRAIFNRWSGATPGKPVLVAGVVWLAILGTGFFALAREEFTPAASAPPTRMFPRHSALALATDCPTLILFAHPHCPCTRATLRELESLLANGQRKVAVTILFTLPRGVAPDWEQGETWRSVMRMPGVGVFTDRDARETERFGIRASGHVLLYQPSGQLSFSGGITPSRGHEGDNPGRSAVTSLLFHERAAVTDTPVFGCPLLEGPASEP